MHDVDVLIGIVNHYRNLGWKVLSNSHGHIVFMKQKDVKKPESCFVIAGTAKVIEYIDYTKHSRRKKWN